MGEEWFYGGWEGTQGRVVQLRESLVVVRGRVGERSDGVMAVVGRKVRGWKRFRLGETTP